MFSRGLWQEGKKERRQVEKASWQEGEVEGSYTLEARGPANYINHQISYIIDVITGPRYVFVPHSSHEEVAIAVYCTKCQSYKYADIIEMSRDLRSRKPCSVKDVTALAEMNTCFTEIVR